MRIALATLAAGLIATLLAWRYAAHRWALPCPAQFGWLLDLAVRERILPTALTLDRMGLRPGQRVLEVGPGSGYMSVPVARRLGETGHLVALELQAPLAQEARRQLAAAGVANAEVREGDVTTAPLEASAYDLAVLVTVLGEITNRDVAISRLREALKPGGILSFTEVFGDPHYQRYADLERRCLAAGLEPVVRHGSWLAYTANFRRPEGSEKSQRPGRRTER
jgi:protein-L-isoaspartate O-methyltransferase